MRKRHLYQCRHPFDEYPFEAIYCGSWQTVQFIRVKRGTFIFYLEGIGCVAEEKGLISSLRIRARKANLSDCTCFLRPGVDIRVLSTSEDTGSSSEENLQPVWVDAKISSIERKPHDTRCTCEFYVIVYGTEELGTEKGTLNKEEKKIEIDKIFILQKLERNPSETEHFRWKFSEDCSVVQKSKLFLGKFSSDLSWLLVASVLKRSIFDVKSIQNKIVYQILNGEKDENCSLRGVNFKLENGVSTPFVVPFFLHDALEAKPIAKLDASEPLPFSEVVELRRSNRRNVQPERYYGDINIPETDINLLRLMPSPIGKPKNEESYPQQRATITYPETLLVYKRKKKRKNSKLGQENQSQFNSDTFQSQTLSLARQPAPLNIEIPESQSEELHDDLPLKYYIKSRRAAKKLKMDDIPEVRYIDFESIYKGDSSNRKPHRSYSTTYSKRERIHDLRVRRSTAVSVARYKDLITTFMKHIESTFKKEEPRVIDEWKKIQATNCLGKTVDEEDDATNSVDDDEKESSDTEMLWREMEISLASTYILEENEGSSVDLSPGVEKRFGKGGGPQCQHNYKLDEEIGIVCLLCGFVSTEIKDVSPPFMNNTGWSSRNWRCDEEKELEHNNANEDVELDFLPFPSSPDAPLTEGNDNVWALIPDLKMRLHLHQKRAFEFLWRNIAGSIVPTQMESAVKKRGGCVISHSPGAGKTFLIISFLVSYLKLFPGKRPLVLAPKTALYTWHKEFIKWEVPVPVYQIHGCRTYRAQISGRKTEFIHGKVKPTRDVMHILDCLEKIQKWHEEPSILLMGYTSFLALTREKTKFAHGKYMCKVLRESPGVLVLDEGHNPRSTGSRLRKALMKVQTGLRILLSGTLFQNNFTEYFNTLCLARPIFVNEVLRKLDPKFKRSKKKKAQPLIEARARKFFKDKISDKINSNVAEDRIEGLNILKSITNGFIDAYEGGTSDNLPGLQNYTLLMKSTPVQQDILVRLHKEKGLVRGYPLELELLITLAAIHPRLIKSSACAEKYFSLFELEELNKCSDWREGAKVKFVVRLVQWCIINQEKVLIFCHNIAPIKLLIEVLEMTYRWRRGREILVLKGDIELFERGRIMDKFEEPNGASKILLASITACAEGISLTAASRVILLDSEWNPAKSRQAVARAFRPGQEKVVYVYQLLATGTLEEEKYSRTTWKEWVSRMIFSEELVEDPSCWQAQIIEDELLREVVAEDRGKSFHMIMKNEKTSNGLVRRGKA